MRNVYKAFGGVHAVEDVTVDLYPGEVVGLVGHNGAGKSTLIKILSGVFQADGGRIFIEGEEITIRNPRDARRYGIETIYQNLALADNLDAPANIFLGRELMRGFALNEDAMEAESRKVLDRLRITVPSLRESVISLSGGQRQAVAIGRALHFNARILIIDEPTAALGPAEARQVGQLIKQLKGEGVGIFLISHDIHDVFEYADRISVLKTGRLVGTVRKTEVTKDDVLTMIIAGILPQRGVVARPVAP
jgi:D-xylose transport system ATP-binding protein